MRRAIPVLLIAAMATACGDPDTIDTRGYTKAPLEDPGVLVAGEDETRMSEINRTNRPRPPLDLGVDEEDAAESGEGEGPGTAAEPQVTLAAGVTQEQFDQGRQLFTGQGGCQACHGPDAGGTMLAPSLADGEWLHVSGPEVEAIAEIIRTGVPDPVEHPAPMPPMGGATLTPEQVQALAGYVASIAQQ